MKKGKKKWLIAALMAVATAAEVLVPGPVTTLGSQLVAVILGDPVHEVKP